MAMAMVMATAMEEERKRGNLDKRLNADYQKFPLIFLASFLQKCYFDMLS